MSISSISEHITAFLSNLPNFVDSLSPLLFITVPKTLYIWNQGTKIYNLEQKNFNFAVINFSFVHISKALRGCSSLNMRCISEKLIYLELGKHNLQYGSRIFQFGDILFQTLLGPTWLSTVHVVWKFPQAEMEGSQPDTVQHEIAIYAYIYSKLRWI